MSDQVGFVVVGRAQPDGPIELLPYARVYTDAGEAEEVAEEERERATRRRLEARYAIAQVTLLSDFR